MPSTHETSELIAELSETIRRATWGAGAWDNLCEGISSAFPGSYCALINQNIRDPSFNLLVTKGLDDKHVASYISHYAFCNPWSKFNTSAPSGSIIVSERDDPVSRYTETEYYRDWMSKVGDFDAAVGIRVGGTRDETIFMPVQFSTRQRNEYEARLEYLMRGIRPVLLEALHIKQEFRDLGLKHNALSAIVGRDDAVAFVMDERLSVHAANSRAEHAFRDRRWLRCMDNRISFANQGAQSEFAALCSALKEPSALSTGRMVFRHGERVAVITVSPLPQVVAGGLAGSLRQYLVMAIDPVEPRPTPDATVICHAFDLTKSEAVLATTLARGLALPEACRELGISYETGRHKLKTIFQKTGAESQADLRVMLARL